MPNQEVVICQIRKCDFKCKELCLSNAFFKVGFAKSSARWAYFICALVLRASELNTAYKQRLSACSEYFEKSWRRVAIKYSSNVIGYIKSICNRPTGDEISFSANSSKFVKDMPRLSVDIDLTYLPLKNRNESLREINSNLITLKQHINMH